MIKINLKKKKFKNSNLAPIALFTYNRLEHLKKSLNSLKKNELIKYSDLIIFSDGAKKENERYDVDRVRNFIKNIKGFNSVKIYFRNKNYGLSKNIIFGISQVLKKYPNVIVLEDDLVVDKFFLDFMNNGLKIYEKNLSVASIHGYIYPVSFPSNVPEYFFIKGADCWGWATWRRAWKGFEKNGKKLLARIDKKNLKESFNFNNTYDYYQMLKNQTKGKNDSWAVRWYASAFLKDMFTLYPSKTFVKNIGIDGSGTHGSGNYQLNSNKISRTKYLEIKKLKIKIEENFTAKQKIQSYFIKNSDNWLKKVLKKIF